MALVRRRCVRGRRLALLLSAGRCRANHDATDGREPGEQQSCEKQSNHSHVCLATKQTGENSLERRVGKPLSHCSAKSDDPWVAQK